MDNLFYKRVSSKYVDIEMQVVNLILNGQSLLPQKNEIVSELKNVVNLILNGQSLLHYCG